MSKAKKLNMNGRVLYRGPSALDGAPIVVIAIGFDTSSSNSKTGDMIQTYILRADMRPNEAVRTGQDSSICGDCIHRGIVVTDKTGETKNVGRTCYVNYGQGPLSAYDCFIAGGYPDWDEARDRPLVIGRKVRIASYGESTAAPFVVWTNLLIGTDGNTGYTHQWRDPRFAAFRDLCMASVDTDDEMHEAHALGWRTFRVGLPGDSQTRKVEALCPASAEAGRRLKCADCMACSGRGFGSAPRLSGSIYIPAHGGFAVMANINKRAAQKFLTVVRNEEAA